LAVATAKIDSEKDLMAFSAAELPLAAFFSIGFTHHIAILAKAKTLEERKYYRGNRQAGHQPSGRGRCSRSNRGRSSTACRYRQR